MNSKRNNDKYVKYLYSIINKKNGPTYYHLLNLLHTIKFEWTVKNDDNRISDALEIREEYIEKTGTDLFSNDDVSVLEVLIGIIHRMMYLMYGENRGVTTSKLFIELLYNLKIHEYTDLMFLKKGKASFIQRDVCKKIDKMIKRKYKKNGQGGLFPLKSIGKSSNLDLRNAELWYQMMYYLEENYQ